MADEKSYISLYINKYSGNDNNKPDLTGNIVVPISMLEAASIDPSCLANINGVECIKLRVACWESSQVKEGEPILKGSLSRPLPKGDENTPPPIKKAVEPVGRKKLS